MNFHSSPTSTLKAAMKCHVNGVSKEARPSPGSPARLPPPTTAGTRRPSTQRSGRLGAGGFPTGGDTRTQPAGRSLCPRLFPVTFFFKRTGHAADAAPSQPPRGRVTKEETQAGNGRARLFLRARAKRLPPCVQHAPPWVCGRCSGSLPGRPGSSGRAAASEQQPHRPPLRRGSARLCACAVGALGASAARLLPAHGVTGWLPGAPGSEPGRPHDQVAEPSLSTHRGSVPSPRVGHAPGREEPSRCPPAAGGGPARAPQAVGDDTLIF